MSSLSPYILTSLTAVLAAAFTSQPNESVNAPAEATSAPGGDVQLLVVPTTAGEPFVVAVEIDGAARMALLEPVSVRGASFQLLVEQPGGALHAVEPSPPRTYRGSLLDEPGSVVTGSLSPSGLRAVIQAPSLEEVWEVEPLGGRDARGTQHAVRVARAPELPLQCGVEGEAAVDRPTPWSGVKSGGLKICEIAIDCDVDYYGYYGSDVFDTLTAVESRIAAITPMFEADVNRTFELGTVIVRTDPLNDPYASYGESLQTLLGLFRDEWKANCTWVSRDTALLFTFKFDIQYIGYANVGSMCTCQSFSVCREVGTAYNDKLVAHELGHVFGAKHCSGSDCWVMCSDLCGSLLQFGSAAKLAINSEEHACLSTSPPVAPPVLSTITPLQIPALAVSPVTVTGTGLSDTKRMRVVAAWGEIEEDCSFSIEDDGTLTYHPPSPLAVGPVQVAAVGTPGSSNALTFEYLATDPPLVVAPGFVLLPKEVTWRVGAQPFQTAILTLSLNDGTTTTVGGFTVLANGQPIALGALDAAGLGEHTRQVPAAAAPGFMYSQLTLYDGGALVGASNIHALELKAPLGGGGGL